MPQIVTGYTGTEHIKPEMDRSFNASIVGSGSWRTSTGDKCAVTVVDANTVQVAAGDVIMMGMHVTVQEPESYSIANGATGYNRNDLLVLHYEKDASTSVEEVTFKVIEGTPTTGAAADPSYTAGDILAGAVVSEVPLARIPISGLAPGDPVMLLDVFAGIDAIRTELKSVRESVSPSDYVTLMGDSGYYTMGRLVVLTVNYVVTRDLAAYEGDTLGKMPANLWPHSVARTMLCRNGGDSGCWIFVDTYGNVRVGCRAATMPAGEKVYGQLVYMAAG